MEINPPGTVRVSSFAQFSRPAIAPMRLSSTFSTVRLGSFSGGICAHARARPRSIALVNSNRQLYTNMILSNWYYVHNPDAASSVSFTRWIKLHRCPQEGESNLSITARFSKMLHSDSDMYAPQCEIYSLATRSVQATEYKSFQR